MSELPRSNNKQSSKVHASQSIKCPRPLAQRIMGSNHSQRRTERNVPLDSATAADITRVPERRACAFTAPPVNPITLRVRKKGAHVSLRPAKASTLHGITSPTSAVACESVGMSPLVVASVMVNASGSCNLIDETARDRNEATITRGTPIYSATTEDPAAPVVAPNLPQLPNCLQSIGAPTDVSKLLKATTTATPASTLKFARQFTTTSRADSAVLQLTKVKKITESTVTTATTMTGTARSCTYATRRLQSVAAATTVRSTSSTTALITAAAAEEALPTTIVKSKFTENKCLLEVLTNVSNHRKVEASGTISAPKWHTLKGNNTNADSQNCSSIKEEPSNNWLPAHSSTTAAGVQENNSKKDIKVTLNLAARKAKLKAEFFGEFDLNEQATNGWTTATQSTKLLSGCTRAAGFATSSQTDYLQSQIEADSTWNSFHQSTHLPTIKFSTISVNADHITSPTSLVSKRKFDLKRKFDAKLSFNIGNPCLIGRGSFFPRVGELVQKFDTQPVSSERKMIVNAKKMSDSSDNSLLSVKPDVLEQRNSPLSDEGCNLGQSPYSSDNEDNESICTTSTTIEQSKRKDKVARSASSDSALGLDVDESIETTPAHPPVGTQQRRLTLTVTDLPLRPALLPLAEPTALPDSPTVDLQQTVNHLLTQSTVPSKVLLEERVVELPEDSRSLAPSLAGSRRESAQSCGSDFTSTEFSGGRRFVRTPSVVVSDYSDDVMCGITLEEIEYFRAQRMRRRHSSLDTANEGEGESDVSAASSCSNLYYCGSTISALDGGECYVNGVRTALDRKASDCSTYSAGADEEPFSIPEYPQRGNDLVELLAAQHLSTKQAKKVGLVVPLCDNVTGKASY